MLQTQGSGRWGDGVIFKFTNGGVLDYKTLESIFKNTGIWGAARRTSGSRGSAICTALGNPPGTRPRLNDCLISQRNPRSQTRHSDSHKLCQHFAEKQPDCQLPHETPWGRQQPLRLRATYGSMQGQRTVRDGAMAEAMPYRDFPPNLAKYRAAYDLAWKLPTIGHGVNVKSLTAMPFVCRRKRPRHSARRQLEVFDLQTAATELHSRGRQALFGHSSAAQWITSSTGRFMLSWDGERIVPILITAGYALPAVSMFGMPSRTRPHRSGFSSCTPYAKFMA